MEIGNEDCSEVLYNELTTKRPAYASLFVILSIILLESLYFYTLHR